MGSSGEKRAGRKHLPKVGTATEGKDATRRDREAVEQNLGIRPGSGFAWIVGVVILLAAAAAVIALVALD